MQHLRRHGGGRRDDSAVRGNGLDDLRSIRDQLGLVCGGLDRHSLRGGVSAPAVRTATDRDRLGRSQGLA